MSAVTCDARPSTTLTATSRPDSAPFMMAVSDSTVPLTEPLSPMVSLPAVRLPDTLPAMWISPLQAISPSTRNPSLRMEGTRRRCALLGPLFGVDLNHILSYFHELCWIKWGSVDQDLVVNMRAGAATGAPEFTDLDMGADSLTARDKYTMKMGITRDNSMSVIDLDHAARFSARARKHHSARSGAVNGRPIRAREI